MIRPKPNTLAQWAAQPQPAPKQTCPECGRVVRVFDCGDVVRHNRAPTPDPVKADGPYLDKCPHRGAPAEPSVIDSIHDAGVVPAEVLGALYVREKVGVAKYGARLRANNGRSAAVDYGQEQLDATVYAWQAGMESAGWRRLVWRVLARLAAVSAWIAWQVAQ